MKQLFLVLIVSAALFSCSSKQASDQLASKKETLSAMEVKQRYGIELPVFDYTGTARGKKSAATLLTVTTDLTLTESAGVLTTSISPNAEWGGVQKFFTIDTTNNGVSVCNWNWSNVTAPASQTCQSNGTGSYRSWTSDKVTYDVHLSAFLPL